MDKECILKNYQNLINLGFSEEMSLQAAQYYPDLDSAIDHILSNCSTFNDNDTNMHQSELDMPSLYKGGINSSSSSKYPPSSMQLNPSNSYQLLNNSSPYRESNLSSDSEYTQIPPNLLGGPSLLEIPKPPPPPQTLLKSQSPPSFPSPKMPSQTTPVSGFLADTQSYNQFNPPPKATFHNPPDSPSLYPPDINSPQEPKNHYGNKSSMQGSKALDHQSWENEPFYEFLVNCLASRGFDEAIISMICAPCTSKEEALLILGIPTFYKSQPLSDIPLKYIMPDALSSDYSSKIKKELLESGAPLEVAESLSLSCETIEDAMQIYYLSNEIEDPINLSNKPSHPLQSQAPIKYPIPPSTSIDYFHPNIYHKKHNINMPKSSSSSSSDSFEGSDSSSEIRPSKSKPLVLSEQTENDPKAPESKSIYFENLKNFRVMLSESPSNFDHFRLGAITSSSSIFTKRITNEIKSLESTLPCDSAASIFTLMDQKCMHRLYFLLSGTLDTPYAHGLYLFEVLLPENYPMMPPKVELRTTGGSSIRFNPNLYDSGYVCLSIINTWSGRPEEQWNPSSSSLVQVMISIQSLVMDNNILQKEPGWSKYPANCPENLTYQQEVKYGNIKYAMIENIKNPPKGFEEVVRNHFKCKKQEIIETVGKWTEEMRLLKKIGRTSQNKKINAEINQKGPFKAFSDLNTELVSLLNSL